MIDGQNLFNQPLRNDLITSQPARRRGGDAVTASLCMSQ